MTKQEIIKKANSFRGANREFSQEMGPIVEGILDMVEDNAEAIETKQDAPEEAGTAGQILKLDANGEPVWSDAPGGSVIDDEMSDESPNPVKNNVIWSWVTGLIAAVKEWATNLFAKQDGWYDTLVSGAAKNLVGHGTTPAEYTFRTSGGNADIGTGTATIDVLKGKTLKWQQKIAILSTDGSKEESGITIVDNRDGSYTVSGTASAQVILYIGTLTIKSGHKYLYKGCPSGGSNDTYKLSGSTFDDFGNGAIYSALSDGAQNVNILVRSGVTISTPIVFKPQFYDLTEMGLDSITSAAEFKALYPLDYYAYTATPVLINNAASGIVTTGFNQFPSTPFNAANISTQTWPAFDKTKYARLFANTRYYVRHDSLNVTNWRHYFKIYDLNGVELKFPNIFVEAPMSPWYSSSYSAFVESADSTYTNFYLKVSQDCYVFFGYGAGAVTSTTTIDNFCINLSWSGYRNGEYEPYEKHTLYFNGESGSLATLKGQKLVNGEPDGNSVYIFDQTGMKSAGSVYDFGKADSDGYIRKVTKRIGSIDLGTLTWNYTGNYFSENDFVSKMPDCKNGICTIYDVTSLSELNTYNDKTVGLGTQIYVRDTSYTDAETFKTAMNGVILYFELKEPEEYLLDTPIPANYLVNDFGTEQRIPVDTANSVMAPILYDCQYALNAVDTVRRLPITYIKKESMDNFTTELASKLGTFLDATITITPSYDATDEEYDYSITITANENNG